MNSKDVERFRFSALVSIVIAIAFLILFAPQLAYADGEGDVGQEGDQNTPAPVVTEPAPAKDLAQVTNPSPKEGDGEQPKNDPNSTGKNEQPEQPAADKAPQPSEGQSLQAAAADEKPEAYRVEREPQQLTAQSQAVSAQAAATPKAGLTFRVHVQNIGDQGWRSAGVGQGSKAMAGTSGRSLRMESLQFKLTGDLPGSVQYQVHVQNDGWQTVRADGQRAGTTGRSLRLEGLSLALVGEVSRYYDVYYRVHVQNDGWQGWRANGQYAGTTGRSLRLEAIEVYLKAKASPSAASDEGLVGVVYQGHVQNVGWQDVKSSGGTAGTSGQSLRVEALRIWLNKGKYSGGIRYKSHVQNVGWQGWKTDGAMSGTSGRSLRLEAIEIELTGDIAQDYDVYYRTHVQNIGWLDWAKNGQMAGSSGMAYRMEALQITLVKKGGAAPGPTAIPSTTNKWDYYEKRYLSNSSVKELLEVRYTGGTYADIVLRQKRSGAWKTVMSCQGYVGEAGIGSANAWTARTPEGDFGITKAFGIESNPGSKLPYVKVTSAMYWCGDEAYYNQLIDINEHPHWCEGEHLIDYSPDYDYGLFFDYNTNPVVYGKGAAFFVQRPNGKKLFCPPGQKSFFRCLRRPRMI